MKRLAYGLCAVCVLVAVSGCGPSTGSIRDKAITEYQLGHTDQARGLFQRVLDREPTDPQSYYYLGCIAHADGFYERAIFCYQCTLDVDPSFTPARVALKRAQEQMGDLSQKLKIITDQPARMLP
jgi:tetratricopeptide (TPR) repeat protein